MIGVTGCRRERSVSRLDPLPDLAVASSQGAPQPDDAGVGGAPPVPPDVGPPVPEPAPPQAPEVSDETGDGGDEAESVPPETEAAEEQVEEETTEPDEPEPESNPQDAARIAQLEGENAVLRQELEALRAEQELLASEVARIEGDINTLGLGMISDTYGVNPSELALLLEANAAAGRRIDLTPQPPSGPSLPTSRGFGAVPVPTVAPPVVAPPSAPTITGPNINFGSSVGSTRPSTPTVIPAPNAPSVQQFGAPPTIAPRPVR